MIGVFWDVHGHDLHQSKQLASPCNEYHRGSARDIDTIRVFQRPLFAGQADVIRGFHACICKQLPLPTGVNRRQIEVHGLPVTIESGVDQVIQLVNSQAGVKGQDTARIREIRAQGCVPCQHISNSCEAPRSAAEYWGCRRTG